MQTNQDLNQSFQTKERKNYNLKNDVIFKAFFSRKGNEIFLIEFLESLLEIKIKEIEIKEEVNLEKLAVEEKGGRLDLQAKLNSGVIVNIELQMRNYQNIEKRTTYYSSKVIARETERGMDYNNIDEVIMINILGYDLFEFDEYISETMIVLDKHRDFEVLKDMKWYFIELPKFRRQNPNMDKKVNQWLAFVDDYNGEAIQMAEKNNETIKKARTEMEYLTGDEEVRRMAELREKWEMDYISASNSGKREGMRDGIKQGMRDGIKQGLEEGKKQGMRDGIKQGLEEGKKQGMKDGIKQGLEEGKKQGMKDGIKQGLEEGKKQGVKDGAQKEKIEIAKKLLKLKIDIEKIVEATGLSKEEIEKIKKEI